MKLLYCVICHDIFKLNNELRTCKCGLCRGKYHDDNLKAVVNGKGISLGINNNHLRKAVAHMFITGFTAPQDVKCWVRPHAGKFNPNTEIDREL